MEQTGERWFIDLDWFQQNERAFFVLARECLCPKCRERLKADEGEVPATELLSTVRKCCSKEPGFITSNLPIMESVFRLLLAAGNRPIDIEELEKQLSELWGGGVYRVSAEILSHLLSSDQYYGLSPVERAD